MTVEIQLTKGYTAIIDDADADLASFKWMATVKPNGYCNAVRAIPDYSSGQRRQRIIAMHRVILERILGRDLATDEQVDHHDLNPLNNCRSNLRLADRFSNSRNRRRQKNCKSQYKGVIQLSSGHWKATIKAGAGPIHLGVYATEIQAGVAYNKSAIELHGEFAYLNNIPDWQSIDLMPITKTPECGYRGVTFSKQSRKWVARVWENGRSIYVGSNFSNPEVAHEAREKFISERNQR